MLSWSKQFNIFCFLDNQNYASPGHEYECLLAAGITGQQVFSLAQVDALLEKKGWLFGHLSYELNHEVHHLPLKPDPIGFPLIHFFEPEIVIALRANELSIFAPHPEETFEQLQQQELIPVLNSTPVSLQQSVSRNEYLEKIALLKEHIRRGDCYEINYCIDFFAEQVNADPFSLFYKLTSISPNPFSVFYRLNDSYLICASPERFLSKRGALVSSQPIKGTIKRNRENATDDERLKQQLIESTKDRSENVMVVDLVRNDLSIVCKPSTVKVDELFQIYSYPQVHQMISTITGELLEDVSFSEIIHATFPMGSMTGAPKHRVMQLINQYEISARGIFSGSVGYFSPDGNFDFNVVIRSIMYNASTQYLSCKAGSGITFLSNAEEEWEECLLKADAIKKVLG